MDPTSIKILAAVILGFAISAVLGKFLIPMLRRLKAGQSIKEDGPTWHMSKQGTPTMGGIMFIAATVVTALVLNLAEAARGDWTWLVVLLFALIFGVIGPICEEFTYRIGLFSLTKRLSRVAAYIITPLVFGFIHFGWGSIATGGDALIIELLNIPDYILAGVIFAFLYDRFGIGASTTAHVMNNLLSFIQILILHSQGKV